MTDPTTAGQKVTELILDSGATVYVKPLSVLKALALARKAENELPYPDPTPYEIPMDDAKTIEPGQVIPASQNDEYIKLCKQVDNQRDKWAAKHGIFWCVETETPRESLIARYADDIAMMRDLLGDEIPDDDWEATLLYGLISSTVDYNRIIQAAQGVMIVTEEDIRNGWRIFRPAVPLAKPVGRRAKPEPSDPAMAEPPES